MSDEEVIEDLITTQNNQFLKELNSLKKIYALMPEKMAESLDTLIQRVVPKWDLDKIHAETKSKSISLEACVFEATSDTVGIGDPDGDSSTHNSRFYDIKKGDKLCIAGCGGQSEGGNSYYLLGDIWVLIANEHMVHIANPILTRVPNDHPVISIR